MPVRMHDDEVAIDAPLVRRLLRSQMPQLADEPLTLVEPWGTDNALWRLGDRLVVRLPRTQGASDQPEDEARWLPRLARHLPIDIPTPVAVGRPGSGYPFAWAVQRWIPGDGASLERMDDPHRFALDLANFLTHLERVPTDGAPAARNRARPLLDYDHSTRDVIAGAAHLIVAKAAMAIWEQALAASPHSGPPVWVHGDLDGNCLLREGRLCGVVDWGLVCAGDPAVDIQVIWSPLFTERSRHVLLDAMQVDDATIARSRGAAVQQACAALPYYLHTYPLIVERSWHKLEVLGVPRRPGA